LKTICGAIAAAAIEGVKEIPRAWIDALFGRSPWPDQWAMYVVTGTRTVRAKDASFHIEFHWSDNRELNGLVINAFSIETLFSIAPLDVPDSALLRRPRLLGAAVERPGGGDVLQGIPAGEHIRFTLRWPGITPLQL
jgi:hypothetical protein